VWAGRARMTTRASVSSALPPGLLLSTTNVPDLAALTLPSARKGGASCHATARHTPPKCRVALVRTTRAAHLTRAPLTAWDGMMAHSEYKRRIKAMEKEVKLKEKEALKVRMPHRPDCCCCGVGSGVNGWSYLHAGTNGHGSGPGCSKAAPSAAPSAVYQAERGSECRALSTASCSRSECVRAGGEGRSGS
jgi:hypothetical protein